MDRARQSTARAMLLILSRRPAAWPPHQRSGHGKHRARQHPAAHPAPPLYTHVYSPTHYSQPLCSSAHPWEVRAEVSCNLAPSRTSRSGGVCTWPHWCCPGCPPARRTRSSRGGGQSPAKAPREGTPPSGRVPAQQGWQFYSCFSSSGAGEVGGGSSGGGPVLPPQGHRTAGPSSFPNPGQVEQMGKRGKLASSSKVPAGKAGPSPSSCLEARAAPLGSLSSPASLGPVGMHRETH